MFKFDFQLDEPDDAAAECAQAEPVASGSRCARPCFDVSLDELLAQLPDVISYSPLAHPALTEPLLRRDLFDARFQLATEDGDEDGSVAVSGGALAASSGGDAAPATGNTTAATEDAAVARETTAYVDADTDLIPGVYEGGLKSWEGGLDLVDVLAGSPELAARVAGTRVLEVGCGTALPSAFLLRHVLGAPPSPVGVPTTLHLADYNHLVLSLVTLPNLVLAALPFLPPSLLHPPAEETDVESLVPDAEAAGSLTLTPQLKDAFVVLLRERNVVLRFTYGDWSGLAGRLREEEGDGYGVVLTAETIYQESSVDALVDVLRAAWRADTLMLVAAKVLYFGVGGDLAGFVRRVQATGARVETANEWTRGVGRKVVRLAW
ncbi:hypothetical protein Q5752_005810 [Cryptotrichosporon argae]